MNNQPFDALPRFDLREKPFRKFERYIARAMNETYEIDPFMELKLKAHSFVVRFKDAILGFKRYKYDSMLLNQSMDFDCIKLYELPTGWVRVINTNLAVPLGGSSSSELLHCVRDRDKLLAIAKEYHYHRLEGQTFFHYDNEAQRQEWIAMQTPSGDLAIDIRDFGPGVLVMRQ